jgi:hypothetical protein
MSVGHQPRTKSNRATRRGYGKFGLEKGKKREQSPRHLRKSACEKNPAATVQEVTAGTLRQLHTLGNQRFGTSPFSEHFDRWLMNIKEVLWEFESNPNIFPDEQFVAERSQILLKIEQQLEELRRKESFLNEETRNLSNCKKRLENIKTEYITLARELRKRKNSDIRRLYFSFNQLKMMQDEIMQKTPSFLQGIFERDREKKEIEIAQKVNANQRELELAMLEFSTAREKLKEEYGRKIEPVIEAAKNLQREIDDLETDGSLEDRWFACETLADAVNAFLQRKTLQPN